MFHLEKGFDVAVLYDNEPQARRYAEALIAQGFDQNKVFFAEVEGKAESDIEDYFSEKEYLAAVNELYSEILKSVRYVPIEKKELTAARKRYPGITRIVPTLEKIWEEHEDEGWGEFNKTAVCRKVCDRSIADPAYLVDSTIQRFESFFNAIQNRLKPPAKGEAVPAVEETTEEAETEAKAKKKKA